MMYMEMTYILGYKFETMNGKEMTKAVICDNYHEYIRVKEKIINTKGYELIEFDDVFNSKQIPQ